jgi:hypothetical protein
MTVPANTPGTAWGGTSSEPNTTYEGPIEFTFSDTSAVLKKASTSGIGSLTGRPFEYSLDHGATWITATWNNANLTITLSENKTLMLRGDLRTSTGACAFSFSSSTNLTGISGSIISILGGSNGVTRITPAVSMFDYMFFSCKFLTTIPSGLFSGIQGAPAARMFYYTFYGCAGLTGTISADLFSGISGAPATYMFGSTFSGCSGLTGTIPAGLFSEIQGAPATYMFYSTFYGCTGLTGTIPADLFSGIQGAPAESMFGSTFYGCTGLTGTIPADLFSGIQGAPATSMFYQTFYNCSKLTGIGQNFVGVITGTASQMFYYTFYGCAGLIGESAKMTNGTKIYTLTSTMASCYKNCTGLSDYASIPSGWK